MFPEEKIEEEREELLSLVRSGRLSISAKNIELIIRRPGIALETLIRERSQDADLTMVGFVGEDVRKRKTEAFGETKGLGNVLLVSCTHEIELYDEQEDQEAAERETEQASDSAVEQSEPPDEAVEAKASEPDDEIKVTDSAPDAEHRDD